MRENRKYGLTRRRWPVRHSTAGWGLLHLAPDEARQLAAAFDRELSKAMRCEQMVGAHGAALIQRERPPDQGSRRPFLMSGCGRGLLPPGWVREERDVCTPSGESLPSRPGLSRGAIA